MNINSILSGIGLLTLILLMVILSTSSLITDENIKLNIDGHEYNCTVDKQWRMGDDMKNHLYNCNNQTHKLDVYYWNENNIQTYGEIEKIPDIKRIKVIQ